MLADKSWRVEIALVDFIIRGLRSYESYWEVLPSVQYRFGVTDSTNIQWEWGYHIGEASTLDWAIQPQLIIRPTTDR